MRCLLRVWVYNQRQDTRAGPHTLAEPTPFSDARTAAGSKSEPARRPTVGAETRLKHRHTSTIASATTITTSLCMVALNGAAA